MRHLVRKGYEWSGMQFQAVTSISMTLENRTACRAPMTPGDEATFDRMSFLESAGPSHCSYCLYIAKRVINQHALGLTRVASNSGGSDAD